MAVASSVPGFRLLAEPLSQGSSGVTGYARAAPRRKGGSSIGVWRAAWADRVVLVAEEKRCQLRDSGGQGGQGSRSTPEGPAGLRRAGRAVAGGCGHAEGRAVSRLQGRTPEGGAGSGGIPKGSAGMWNVEDRAVSRGRLRACGGQGGQGQLRAAEAAPGKSS